MMNWFWVIPWVVIIIFYAGWHFGGKVAVRKEIREQMRERDNREIEKNYSRTVNDLYRNIEELEKKIERIYATRIKEECNNG